MCGCGTHIYPPAFLSEVVVGEAGANGTNGTNGTNGAAGAAGPQGVPGSGVAIFCDSELGKPNVASYADGQLLFVKETGNQYIKIGSVWQRQGVSRWTDVQSPSGLFTVSAGTFVFNTPPTVKYRVEGDMLHYQINVASMSLSAAGSFIYLSLTNIITSVGGASAAIAVLSEDQGSLYSTSSYIQELSLIPNVSLKRVEIRKRDSSSFGTLADANFIVTGKMLITIP